MSMYGPLGGVGFNLPGGLPSDDNPINNRRTRRGGAGSSMGNISDIPTAFSNVTNQTLQYDFGEFDEGDGEFYMELDIDASLDEFMAEKAAYQIQMAGSIDPVTLIGVSRIDTDWGMGLTVDQILQVVEEYPGIAAGFDMNSNTDDLEGADVLYFDRGFGDSYNQIETKLTQSDLTTNDVIKSSQFENLTDMVFDGSLITEGDSLESSIVDNSIIAIANEKAAAALADQAATQEATTGTVSGTTTTQMNAALGAIRDTKPTSDLYKIYKSNPQGFERFITTIENYTPEMKPEDVDLFLTELGASNSYGQDVEQPLRIAQQSFFNAWDPMDGFKTDADWTPPAYYTEAESLEKIDEHEQGLIEYQKELEAAAVTVDDIFKKKTIDTPVGGSLAVPDFQFTFPKGRKGAFKFGFGPGETPKDFAEEFASDPEMIRKFMAGMKVGLPTDEFGIELGDPNFFQGYGSGFIPDEDGLMGGFTQDQYNTLIKQSNEVGDIKSDLLAERDQFLEADPEYIANGQLASGAGGTIAEMAKARQERIEGLPLSEKLLGDEIYMESVPDEGISPEDIQVYGGTTDQPGATAIDFREFGDQGVTGGIDPTTDKIDAAVSYENLPESKVITDEQGNQRTVLVDPKTQEIISEGPMQGQPSTGGTMTAPFGAFSTEAGVDPSEFFTPEQQFLQYAQRATAPGSPMRRAFYGLQNPLMQQYYLTGRGTDPRYGGAPEFQSFGDFAAQYQRGGIDNQQIRGLAEEAAKIASMSGDEYFDYKYAPGNTDFQQQRIETIRERYKNPEDRQNLARFLATQRQGGGVYGGLIGQTLGSSIDEMANVYASKFPTGGESRNFLNYFLQQTGRKPNGQTTNGV